MRNKIITSLFSVVIYACAYSGISYAEENNITSRALINGSNSAYSNFKRHVFHKKLLGYWRTKSFVQGSWVDLIWYVDRTHAWHIVIAYADEEMKIPLLRWDIVREYKLEEASTVYSKAYNMVWKDRLSKLTPYVDNPAFFSAIGISDCALQVGKSLDTSLDNCGAPLLPFRKCEMMDFVELKNGVMTFGEPQQGDRCSTRPTELEGWSFNRIPFSPELWKALVQPSIN